MTNLMKELMAEAERVKKLETEVKRTTTDLKNEINLAREEKLAKIVSFLCELNEYFCYACPGEKYSINTSGRLKDGNHVWDNEIQFGDKLWLGIWLSGSGSFARECTISKTMLVNSTQRHKEMIESFIDGWTDETRAFTEEYVTEAIRKVLAIRIDKATKDLKAVNDKHAEVCGKE